MKNIIYFFIFLFIQSSSASFAIEKDKFIPFNNDHNIPFKVVHPVDGFEISGSWFPEIYDSYDREKGPCPFVPSVAGPLIIDLKNLQTGEIIQFKERCINLLTYDFFSDVIKNSASGEELSNIIAFLKKMGSINFDYSNISSDDKTSIFKCGWSKGLCLSLGDIRFGFSDLNFDGINDFFIRNARVGQRGGNAYIIHTLASGPDGQLQYNPKTDLGSTLPFNEIDSLTGINLTHKTIVQMKTSNACEFKLLTYTKRNKKFTLTHSRESEISNKGDCIARHYNYYKSPNGKIIKKLISTKIN